MRRFVYLATLVLGHAIDSVTTPAGTHEFGAGVSTNAPCVAFLNLHFNVHLGAFAGSNPNTVSVQVIGPDCPA